MNLSKGYAMLAVAASSPTPTPGMSLWLKADAGVLNGSGNPASNGDVVATWQDQSGNGNNGTSSGSLQPTYATNALNRNPVVAFNLSQITLPNLGLTSDFSIFMVRQQTSVAIYPIPWEFTNAYYVHCPYGTSSSFCQWRPSVRTNPNVNTTSYYVLDWIETGSECDLYNNGTLTAQYTGGSAPNLSGAGMWLGDDALHNGTGIVGNTAEFIVYPTALSTANRQQTENYLLGKYGL